MKEMKRKFRKIPQKPKEKMLESIFSPHYKSSDLMRDPLKPLKSRADSKKLVLKKKMVNKSGYKATTFDLKEKFSGKEIPGIEQIMSNSTQFRSNKEIRNLCEYVYDIK